MNKYLEEQDELIESFIRNTFIREMKLNKRKKPVGGNYSSIEINFDYTCDLKCSYCYYSKYGKDLYRRESRPKEEVLNNLKKVMNMIVSNELTPNLEIFNGEFFRIGYWQEALDIIYDYLRKANLENRPGFISIPSNVSVAIDRKDARKVKKYIEEFSNLGVRIALSASFDGPYMDIYNRQSKKKDYYTKGYYDKVIDFCSEVRAGFHPMIYSDNSEAILENTLWFTDHPYIKNLYLLEVRNQEWTLEEAKTLYYNLYLLILKIYNDYDRDIYKFAKTVMEDKNGYNILKNLYGTVGRGLGCSIQSTLNIQLNDLSIIPCHRLSYKGQVAGYLDIRDDGSFKIKSDNPELYLAIQATNAREFTPCVTCPISELCGSTCLGSNYEATGELFSPSPSVCRMEFYKVNAITHALDSIGYLDKFLYNIRYDNPRLFSQVEEIRNTRVI